jgi:hypothetical protein
VESEFSSPSTKNRGALLLAAVWYYNMGIYSCKTGCSKMYMYNETTGKNGSNKSVSLLFNTTLINVSEVMTTLHLFSNNCAGQNKNILMIQFLNSRHQKGSLTF